MFNRSMPEALTNRSNGVDESIVLSVTMPVYNEQAALRDVISEHVNVLESLVTSGRISDWEVVCLDDGSTDRSPQILEDMAAEIPRVRIMRHRRNLGMFQTMTDVARAARGTHVYLTGSDGQWPAENLIRLVDAVRQSGADIAVWARQNRSEVYSLRRRILSYGFNLLPRVLFGVRTVDAGSAKLAIKELYELDLISRSNFFEAERLIVAHRRGYRAVHVQADFEARSGGKETGARLRCILRSLWDCLRCIRRYGLR